MTSHSQTFLFFGLAFISEVVGTITGFGSSVFFVPLAAMIFDLKTALALTGILHIFSTSAQVIMFRKEINFGLLMKIGIPSVLFVLLGAHLNKSLDLRIAQLLMGVFLIAFSITFLVNKNIAIKPTLFNAISGGAIAGLLAGLIGTGGAVRGATLTAFALTKAAFVGTSAGIDFAVDLSRTAVYLSNGYLSATYYWYLPVMLFLAYTGALLGRKLLTLLSEELFRKIVLFLILAVGLMTFYRALSGKEILG